MRRDAFKSRKNQKLLREILGEYIADNVSTLPATEQPTAYFSAEYESYMKKLIQKQQKVYYYWTNTAPKKAVCILIAILLMVVATTMSVSALREAFLRFVVETYETFTCVFVGDEKQHEETYEFVPVEPTYIPKGYQLVSEIRDPSTFCLIYQRGDEVFDYYQTIALGGRFGLDTEGTEYEKLYINGNEALYSHNKGISTILLYRDPCVFVINGNANKEELLEIMQSVKFN